MSEPNTFSVGAMVAMDADERRPTIDDQRRFHCTHDEQKVDARAGSQRKPPLE